MTVCWFACSTACVLLGVSGIGVAQEPAPPGLAISALRPEPYVFDTAEQQRIRVSVVNRSLAHPWALAFLPDGSLPSGTTGNARVVGTAAGAPPIRE